MNTRYQSHLVSNHINWELSYEDSQPPQTTRLNAAAGLVISTVCWPILAMTGALMLPFYSYNYFAARWRQDKIIDILSKPKCLNEYSERRIQCCEKQVEDLKSHAIFLMENHLKNTTNVGLPIPREQLSSKSPKNRWKDFPWNEFVNTNFFQKSNVPDIADKKTLQQLEQVRTKINFLSRQKLVLSEPERRIEAIKKIAEMSFVKNAFKRQKSKEWIIHSILWLLPSGMFWDGYFNSPPNERSTYEGNKNFLPTGTDLQTYNDLLDAHNKLVRNNDFVVPYIERKIV